MAVLTLEPVPRGAPARPWLDTRARYTPWLRGRLHCLEFVVDNRSLIHSLQGFAVPEPETYGVGTDWLSVADLAWPEHAATALRQLAGVEPRSEAWLEPGRLPLYVCPVCGDIGCGAITVKVQFEGSLVRWNDFRIENGYAPRHEQIDLSGFPDAVFDRDQYIAALLQPVPQLEALAAEEAAAQAAWKSGRGRRLLGKIVKRGNREGG